MNQHTQDPRRAQFPNWLGLFAAAALVSSVAFAQEKIANQPSSAAEGELVTLSPFVVSADADRGYAATNSLSGTRLNTSLKDVAAAISVVTKDMMKDLGVYNSAQLLTYTLGTEVSGSYGSFSGHGVGPGNLSQDGPNRSLLPNARIRGLANADNTRDFFLTDVPWDGFNTDRVEVNRGPNAMLFGTGSPAGIINQTTSKAHFNRTQSSLQFEFNQFGSARVQVDNNTVLIPERFAVRVALKDSDDRFRQEEAFIKDKRGFIAAVYQPLQLTTIRANFEEGRQRAVKPQNRPPFDLGVQSWFALGKPYVNPLTGAITLTGTPTARISAIDPATGLYNSAVINGSGLSGGGWGSDNPALVFDRPNQVGSIIYGLTGLNAVTNRGPGGTATGRSLVGVRSSRQYQQAQHVGEIGAGAYTETQFTDPALFNFYDHLLEGPNKPESAKWHVFSASIEQLLPNRKGGIELAVNRENTRSSFANPFNWESYGIGIDMNTVLLNGTPNPNLGRPVIASDSWSTENLTTRDNQRATAFYTFEPSFGPEWLRKVIGKHTLSANFSKSERYSVSNGGRHLVAGPEYVSLNPILAARSAPHVITNGSPRGFQTVVYLGNATSGSNAAGMNIQPVTVDVLVPNVNSVPVHFYNNLTGTWQTPGISILRGSEFDKSSVDLAWTGGASRSETNSKVYILHSSMFNGTVLPTLGYRKDRLSFFNAGSKVNASGFGNEKLPLPDAPSSEAEQESFNWGVVARLPQSMESRLPLGLKPSLFYNKSDNFSPSGQRVNMFGQNIDPEKGETKEFGVIVSALDDKLSLRLTHFETGITGTTVDIRDAIHSVIRDGIGNVLIFNAAGGNDNNLAARNAFQSWWTTAPLAATVRSVFGADAKNSPDATLRQTKDSVSTGEEIELIFNPTNNWRIALNASKSEVVNTNTARDALEFLTQIQPILNGPAGQVWVNNAPTTWAQQANKFVNSVNGLVYADGQQVNPELRKYRLNALTNYTFTSDGLLKNVSVGGAVRWADKVLIGTGFVASPRGDIPDYSRLYFGPSTVQYDAWVSYRRPNIFRDVDWDIQLNVRNIGVDQKLIPVAVQPNGQFAQWRIAEPMTFTLSTKFSF